MKTQLMIIIFLLFTVSCASQKKEMISKSTIKLEGKNTDIRDKIEIDGYYQQTNTDNRTGIMLFEDGSCGSFWFKESVTENEKRENLSQAIDSWKRKGQVRWGNYWGVYKIDKDTIVVQDLVKAGWFSMPWSFSETKYEIIDRRTLKCIYLKYLYPTDKNDKKKDPYKIRERNFISKFVPADSLPSSDSWLKEEKWIWRNEQDWKNYMQHVEQVKKLYKKK